MARTVRHPSVRDDVREILAYLAPRKLEAALGLIDAFEAVVNRLAAQPELGPHPVFLREPRHAEIRFMVVPEYPNYLVFYRPLSGGIEVLHFLHGARDISDLFDHE